MFIKQTKASTLIELLITVTVFSIVATTSATVMVNTLKSTKKIQNQVFLYSEAQTLMDQLARVVEQNTVDYEVYYAREVQGEVGWDTPNYGMYAMTFYDPGSSGPDSGPLSDTNPLVTGYGAYCAGSGVDVYPDDCDMPDYTTLDQDMGAHPFPDISDFDVTLPDNEDYMNAFCENTGGTDTCQGIEHFVSNELVLINNMGDERTVFVLEPVSSSDNRLSKVQMSGTDGDGDGVVDTWVCLDGYDCTGLGNVVPNPNDLTLYETKQADFMPMTPSSIDIQEFYVYIAPNEDPYRAFAELGVQVQPQVTIVFKASLSDDYSSGLIGEVPSITLQRTVSTGVYERIVSWE